LHSTHGLLEKFPKGYRGHLVDIKKLRNWEVLLGWTSVQIRKLLANIYNLYHTIFSQKLTSIYPITLPNCPWPPDCLLWR